MEEIILLLCLDFNRAGFKPDEGCCTECQETDESGISGMTMLEDPGKRPVVASVCCTHARLLRVNGEVPWNNALCERAKVRVNLPKPYKSSR